MSASPNPIWKMFIGILLASAFFLFSIISLAAVNLQQDSSLNFTSSLLPFFGEKVNLQSSSKSKLKISLDTINTGNVFVNETDSNLDIHLSTSLNGNRLVALAKSKISDEAKYNVRIWESDRTYLVATKDNSDPVFYDYKDNLLGLRLNESQQTPSLEVYDFNINKVLFNLQIPKSNNGKYYNATVFPYISPDHKTLAIHYFLNDKNNLSNMVGIWGLEDGQLKNKIETPDFSFLDFTPDSKFINLSSNDVHEQAFYNIVTGKNDFSIVDTSISKNSKFIKDNVYVTTNQKNLDEAAYLTSTSGTPTGQVTLWDTLNKRVVQQLSADSDSHISDVAYMSGNNILVAASSDSTLSFFDLTKNILIQSFNKKINYDKGSGSQSIIAVKIWPDNNKLLVIFQSGEIKFYQVDVTQ